MRLDSSGRLGLGTSSPSARLNILGDYGQQLILQQSATNSVAKGGNFNTAHYTNTEEPVLVSAGYSSVSENICYYGGGWTSSNAATVLRFYTAANTTTTEGTERMRIDSSGNVGIGTQTPAQKLVLREAGASEVYLQCVNNSGAASFYAGLTSSGDMSLQGNNALLFQAGGFAERARIDSSGRLLVGTSSAFGSGPSQVATTNSHAIDIGGFNTFAANSGRLTFYRSKNGTIGSGTVLAANDSVGRIDFRGYDSNTYELAAQIQCEVDGTPGDGDMPGRLVFSTTADGASSPTERLRIDSAGQIEAGSLGTAAAPVWSFLADTNTGIYSPGADQVAISTNGTGRLFVDASGRVGVGTSPSYTLDVAGSTSTARLGKLQILNDAPFITGANIDSGANTVALGSSGNAPALFFTNNTERMRLDSSGRLGLGTSSPSTTNGGLDIASGGLSLIIGADGSLSSRTNATNKQARIGAYHYTNAEEPVGIATVFSTASSNAIYFGGGTSSLNAATALEFYTAANTTTTTGTQRMVIDSSGRVGIGTTAPDTYNADANNLVIQEASGNGGITIRTDTASAGGLFFADGVTADGSAATNRGMLRYDHSNDSMQFWTAGNNERARIDSSGRLLVGTSSVTSNIVTMAIQGSPNSATDGPAFLMKKNTATPADGDSLGGIIWSDNTDNLAIAITGRRDGGTWSASSKPTRLVFSTTADGASSPTERMRIASTGDVYFGTTTVNPGIGNTATGTLIRNGTADSDRYIAVSRNAGAGLFVNRNTNDGSVCDFARAGTSVGTISVTASATAYNTSSDYRLKENVVPLTGAADRVNQLQVHRFNFIADPDTTVDGFIAHEAQTVVPECVTGEKDAVDKNGNPVYQGIDQSKLVPLLTAALQEALQKIEDLEGRLTAAGI
jgi:hypothetical protein